MSALNILSFVIEPLENGVRALSIVTVVDDIRLTKLIGEFERNRSYQPTGGYAGRVPDHFNFGPLERYFMAEDPTPPLEKVGHYLLGCSCGEVGCWPLTARIEVDVRLVSWSEFKQPFRPDRDYSDFGPLDFPLSNIAKPYLS